MARLKTHHRRKERSLDLHHRRRFYRDPWWEVGDLDDSDESQAWLSACGEYIENGLHCPTCLQEPPWGCPCSWCQGERYEEEDDYYGYGPEIDPYEGLEMISEER